MSRAARRWTALCVPALVAVLILVAANAGFTERQDSAAAVRAAPPKGVKENCSTRSEATFPRPFRNPDNLVVGPLALVGGALAAEDPYIRRHGEQKFPLLVKAGRRVTVHLDRDTRRFARLAYGPLPQGKRRFRDAHHTVRFAACRRKVVGPYTFWSGFVLVKRPACVTLNVYVGRRSRPRVAQLSMDAGDCKVPAT